MVALFVIKPKWLERGYKCYRLVCRWVNFIVNHFLRQQTWFSYYKKIFKIFYVSCNLTYFIILDYITWSAHFLGCKDRCLLLQCWVVHFQYLDQNATIPNHIVRQELLPTHVHLYCIDNMLLKLRNQIILTVILW